MADVPQDENYSGDEPPTEAFDWEEFAHHLEDSELSDEQKQDFIETLYGIMLSMVDLGIDLRSGVAGLPGDHEQRAGGCGQNAESGIFPSDDLVSSINTNTTEDGIEKVRGCSSLQDSAFKLKEES